MQQLLDLLDNSIEFAQNRPVIKDVDKLRAGMPRLARVLAIGDPMQAAEARFLVRLLAYQLGIFPASIHDLYIRRSRGDVPTTWTAPAINLRVLPFDCARAAFRSARKIDAALMIFEIARVELAWSGQTLGEYAAQVLAAAIAEGYHGPVFFQGDHFQVSTRYPLEQEKQAIRSLVEQAVRAGFYNIDIDTSTLVDLSYPEVRTQQRLNAISSAELAAFIRQVQPEGIHISIGGEIGEVGGHVSTQEELRAYISLFEDEFTRLAPRQPGLSKISIHSGSTHGGVALPDGQIAEAPIDFRAIRELGQAAQAYGLGGVVQHGASTLAYENFDRLVGAGTLEVHLATAFMKTFFQGLPDDLRQEYRHWLDQQYAGERTETMTDLQFYHQTEKFALGDYKEKFWNLPASVLEKISAAWEAQFDHLFNRLGCTNTRGMVEESIKPVMVALTWEDVDDFPHDSRPIKGLAG